MFTDPRIRSWLIQALVFAGVILVVVVVGLTTVENLSSRGIPLGMDFVQYRAGFTIPESVLPYSPDDSYLWAIVVGIGNTIFVSLVVGVLCTVMGVFLGIARLSSNPLVRGLSRFWVETARNTPPILMLIFLYSLWWYVMPQAKNAWELGFGSFLSIRGLVTPKIELGWSTSVVIGLISVTLVGMWVARRAARRVQEKTGTRRPYAIYVLAGMLATITVAAIIVPDTATIEFPYIDRARIRGGFVITPELFTIIIGLTYYTTGFVAEIVRAGIQAVPKGQWEAARSLGLGEGRVLSLIVIPQTLRIIVPPMTSQYINLVKNSTLAIAVGYPDFMVTMTTIINRTSHAFEGVAIIIGAYLLINLSLSFLLNMYNRRLIGQ